jgi:hypothetical protein
VKQIRPLGEVMVVGVVVEGSRKAPDEKSLPQHSYESQHRSHSYG